MRRVTRAGVGAGAGVGGGVGGEGGPADVLPEIAPTLGRKPSVLLCKKHWLAFGSNVKATQPLEASLLQRVQQSATDFEREWWYEPCMGPAWSMV